MSAPALPNARGRVLFIALPVVLLAGGGATYFFFIRPKAPKPPPPEETYTCEINDLTVNLADQDRAHFLSASIGLIIAGPHPEEAVEESHAHICDAVVMVITQHTYKDLLTPEGKQVLKDDINTAVTAVLPDQHHRVTDVLFTTFLMD